MPDLPEPIAYEWRDGVMLTARWLPPGWTAETASRSFIYFTDMSPIASPFPSTSNVRRAYDIAQGQKAKLEEDLREDSKYDEEIQRFFKERLDRLNLQVVFYETRLRELDLAFEARLKDMWEKTVRFAFVTRTESPLGQLDPDLILKIVHFVTPPIPEP